VVVRNVEGPTRKTFEESTTLASSLTLLATSGASRTNGVASFACLSVAVSIRYVQGHTLSRTVSMLCHRCVNFLKKFVTEKIARSASIMSSPYGILFSNAITSFEGYVHLTTTSCKWRFSTVVKSVLCANVPSQYRRSVPPTLLFCCAATDSLCLAVITNLSPRSSCVCSL
jgi:hypothetical protein